MWRLIKEIDIMDDEAVLNYTIPVSSDSISEEKVRVLSSANYGGQKGTRTIQYLIQARDYIYSLRSTESAHKPKVYITVYLNTSSKVTKY